MPTATEDKVFIRWLWSEIEATDDSDVFNVHTHVKLFIDGQDVASVKHWQWNKTAPFDTGLTEALEDKRQDYIVA